MRPRQPSSSNSRVYSIRAGSDPTTAPLSDVIRTGGAGCDDTIQEPIVVNYLEIGDPHDLGSETSPDKVEKSADSSRLQGHRAQSGTGFPPSDSTWSFTGSN